MPFFSFNQTYFKYTTNSFHNKMNIFCALIETLS